MNFHVISCQPLQKAFGSPQIALPADADVLNNGCSQERWALCGAVRDLDYITRMSDEFTRRGLNLRHPPRDATCLFEHVTQEERTCERADGNNR